MQLPPLQLVCNDHFCVSGDVSIAPNATIAPGVLLQADPDCRLVIAAEVCIGAGSVVHAHQGMLEIASGVTLGAGVLIIGKGRVGANACIGARATLWNVEIASNQVVAADARLGEMGRQADSTAVEGEPIAPPSEEAVELAIAPPSPTDPILQDPPRSANPIYGKAALNRLMGSLFPYRESLNGLPPSSDNSDSAQ